MKKNNYISPQTRVIKLEVRKLFLVSGFRTATSPSTGTEQYNTSDAALGDDDFN